MSAGELAAADPLARFTLDTPACSTTTDADRGGQFFHLVFDRAGVPRSRAREQALAEIHAYHAEHNLWEHVPDEVTGALHRFRALGLTLAVASNANGVLHRVLDRVGLTPYFHVVCDSSREGVEKPDPRFFEIVMRRAGGFPSTTLHVGDLYHVDVIGARRAGIRAVLLDPHDLYAAFDVRRVRSLSQLAEDLERLRPVRT